MSSTKIPRRQTLCSYLEPRQLLGRAAGARNEGHPHDELTVEARLALKPAASSSRALLRRTRLDLVD